MTLTEIIADLQARTGGTTPFNTLLNSATAPASLVGGIAWKSGTAPSADVADQVSLWVGDRTAGEAGLRLRSESGVLSHFGDYVGLGTLSPLLMLHLAHPSTSSNKAGMILQNTGLTYPDLSTLFGAFGWSGTAGWHGMAAIASSANGGIAFSGVTSSGTTNGFPLIFTGYHGASGAITNSAVVFRAAKWDGSTSATALAAGEPCHEFRNWTTTLLKLTGSGNVLMNSAASPSSLAKGLVLQTGTAATGTVAAGEVAIWFDGTDLRARIGTTDYTFTKT